MPDWIWLWNTTCRQCGYRSHFYKRKSVARVLALLHAITKHPYGAMTIAAVDQDTYRRNRSSTTAHPLATTICVNLRSSASGQKE